MPAWCHRLTKSQVRKLCPLPLAMRRRPEPILLPMSKGNRRASNSSRLASMHCPAMMRSWQQLQLPPPRIINSSCRAIPLHWRSRWPVPRCASVALTTSIIPMECQLGLAAAIMVSSCLAAFGLKIMSQHRLLR